MTRLLLLLALAALLPLGGCDSEGGTSGSEVDGRFRATAFTFTQEQGTVIGTVDVLSYMERDGGVPVFTVDLFGQDEAYTIAYRLTGEGSRSSIRGSFSGQSDDRIRLDLEGDADGPRVLLPTPLTLTANADRTTLTASQVTTVSFEQLAELDPSRFGGLSGGDVRGRVDLTLVRE